ncbi:MAG: hypothetical protein JNK25_08255 [Phycisphaerae bacterium]|nr:hypothetical protein [Phycisphaerae bacterium]
MFVQNGGWRGPLAAAGLFFAIFTRATAADEVKVYQTVEINGVPQAETLIDEFNSGENFTIDVPFDSSDVEIVRMYRITTNSVTADIGHITLSGNRRPDQPLLVLIAAAETTSWPPDAATPLGAGCRNWAGITCVNGETAPYLRRTVILAASVSGNVQGTSGQQIHVGSVYRLQVRATLTQTQGGYLSLPVRVSGNFGFNGFDHIAYVSVEKGITRDIIAQGEGDDTNPRDITSIFVGDQAGVAGISGCIHATYGSIRSIRCTGPISIPSSVTSPGIYAANGIDLIYTGNDTGDVNQPPNPAYAYDIDTVIRVGEPDLDQPRLERLHTAGDLEQEVFAGRIGTDGSFTEGQTFGIWVGGEVKKPIRVENEVNVSIIRGATFAPGAHVIIGNYLKGTVEAADYSGEVPVYGQLRTVSVGRGMDGSEYNFGFSGVEPAHDDPEGVIRADHIERVSISKMVLAFGKTVEPRIEANEINSLEIGEMFKGIITTPPDAATPYTVFSNATISDIYAQASSAGPLRPQVWCADFESFRIEYGLAGRLEFPTLLPGRVLVIDGEMRNIPEPFSNQWPMTDGIINIADPQGLEGMIVMNGRGTTDPVPAEYCSGPVIIEDGTTDISLSAAASTGNLNTMPEYTRTSGTIGGGAVGLAPFYFYDEDCDPVSGATGENALLQSEFDNVSTDSVPTRPIIVRFYGPVRTDLVSDSPVDLYLRKVLNNTISFTRMPRDSYTVEVNRPGSTGANREIRLYGAGQYRFSSGQYHVRPRESGPPQLYCDFVKFNPAVRDFDYIFDLRLDCDYDGTEDQPWECGVICAAGDFNQDGGVDGADVEAFFLAWENADPSADVNQDGGIDGRDVETFFLAWEAGGC